MIFAKEYLIQQPLSVLKDIARAKGIYNLPDNREIAIACILKFQQQYGDTLVVNVSNLQPGDLFLYFIRQEGVTRADNEDDILWQGWAKATEVYSEPWDGAIAVYIADKHPFVNPEVETLAKNPGSKVYVTFETHVTQLQSGEWLPVSPPEQLTWTDTFLPSTKLIRKS